MSKKSSNGIILDNFSDDFKKTFEKFYTFNGEKDKAAFIRALVLLMIAGLAFGSHIGYVFFDTIVSHTWCMIIGGMLAPTLVLGETMATVAINRIKKIENHNSQKQKKKIDKKMEEPIDMKNVTEKVINTASDNLTTNTILSEIYELLTMIDYVQNGERISLLRKTDSLYNQYLQLKHGDDLKMEDIEKLHMSIKGLKETIMLMLFKDNTQEKDNNLTNEQIINSDALIKKIGQKK